MRIPLSHTISNIVCYSDIFIFLNLTDEKWYLISVLICISLYSQRSWTSFFIFKSFFPLLAGSFADLFFFFGVLKPHCQVRVEFLVVDSSGHLNVPFQSENVCPLVLENSSHVSLIIFSLLFSLFLLSLELVFSRLYQLSLRFLVFLPLYLLLKIFCNSEYMSLYICQNSECTAPRVNSNVNCGLWVRMSVDIGSSVVTNVPSAGGW